jgi:hypothetical protein
MQFAHCVVSYFCYRCLFGSALAGGLFVEATEMSDLGDLAVGSDTLPTASILPDSASINASSDVSKQPPQSTVDAWNLAFNAATKTTQDAGWQPVSPKIWPAGAAFSSNAQRGGLNFAPTMAGGIAGTSLGIAAAGGPEDPLALVMGPVGWRPWRRYDEWAAVLR